MPGVFHELAIDSVCSDYGMARYGASKAFNEVMADGGAYKLGFMPDAFSVDWGKRAITFAEVEDTSKITDRKMLLYTDCWFLLDCESWYMELLIFDRYANLVKKYTDSDFLRLWSKHGGEAY